MGGGCRGVALLFWCVTICAAAPQAWPAGVETAFTVRGMVCSSCKKGVEKALRALPGVESVVVDLKRDRVTLRYNPRQVDPRMMAQALRKAGYLAEFPPR